MQTKVAKMREQAQAQAQARERERREELAKERLKEAQESRKRAEEDLEAANKYLDEERKIRDEINAIKNCKTTTKQQIENYLKLLDLAMAEATKSAVNKKYKEKAMKVHPDRCKEEEKVDCTKKFQDLGQAKDGLINCFENN